MDVKKLNEIIINKEGNSETRAKICECIFNIDTALNISNNALAEQALNNCLKISGRAYLENQKCLLEYLLR